MDDYESWNGVVVLMCVVLLGRVVSEQLAVLQQLGKGLGVPVGLPAAEKPWSLRLANVHEKEHISFKMRVNISGKQGFSASLYCYESGWRYMRLLQWMDTPSGQVDLKFIYPSLGSGMLLSR